MVGGVGVREVVVEAKGVVVADFATPAPWCTITRRLASQTASLSEKRGEEEQEKEQEEREMPNDQGLALNFTVMIHDLFI